MPTLKADLLGNHLTRFFYHIRRPSCRHANTRRKNSGSNGHVPVRSLFGQKNGNTQAGIFHHITLQGIPCFGSQLGIKTVIERLAGPGISPIYGPQHPNVTFFHKLFEFGRVGNIRTFLFIHLPAKRAKHLSHFFLQGHPPNQILHTKVNGLLGIFIQRLRENRRHQQSAKQRHNRKLFHISWLFGMKRPKSHQPSTIFYQGKPSLYCL